MDQHLTVQASTGKTPEGNSRDLHSAASSSTDTTATHDTRYFDFFALAREFRDMIYDQFQRLHPDNPKFREGGRPEFMMSQPTTTKTITPLLLVNKRFSSEYRDACEKRLGVIVSSSVDNLAPEAEFEEEIYSWDAEKASFIHMHAGNWMNCSLLDDPEWTLSPLKDWLAQQDLQMPNLDSITVSIYLSLGSSESAGGRKKLEDALQDFVSAPKLRELRHITMDDALDWRRSEHGPHSKKLLVHWTPSGARELALIDPPQPYVETCCECLGPLDSDTDDLSNDSDDSSSLFGDVNDNGDDDDDDENDSEESDDDLESDDEKAGAGKGFHGDADDGDDENAGNADQDFSEDSDEKGSDGDHTTPEPQTNQAPSYFNFFGLPSEVRDMIFDQPEMLDQGTPLCLYDDEWELHLSSRQMAATKPRTSLLLVNSQFSSEYKKRCEGRSGLFISGKLDHLC